MWLAIRGSIRRVGWIYITSMIAINILQLNLYHGHDSVIVSRDLKCMGEVVYRGYFQCLIYIHF